jgi:hypothetical protein
MGSDNKATQVKLNVVIALIGVIGTITAALIAVSPRLIELGLIGKTEVAFNNFDEPLGLFSIEYPSNFGLISREVNTLTADYKFAPKEFARDKAREDHLAFIYISVGLKDMSNTDVETLGNAFIDDAVLEFNSNESKRVLVSNEKTERGYMTHFQEVFSANSFVDFYILSEYEGNTSALLMFMATSESVKNYSYMIDDIFSSFQWSPSEVLNHFSG